MLRNSAEGLKFQTLVHSPIASTLDSERRIIQRHGSQKFPTPHQKEGHGASPEHPHAW